MEQALMANGTRVTFVIPAYNESRALPGLLRELREICGDDPTVEILVIDDGSDDGTAQAAAAVDGVVVVRHDHNQGNGAAVKTGLRHARGEVGVVLDADGQHPPAAARQLLDRIGEYDLVVGARSPESESSRFRTAGNRVLSALASYLVRFPIPDLTSGMRAFKVPQMRRFMRLYPNRFSLPSTSTLCFLASGLAVAFVPVSTRRRQHGRSSIRPWRDGAQFVRIVVRIVLLFNPGRIFLPAAAVAFLAGAVWWLAGASGAVAGPPVGPQLTMAGAALLAGLGLVGDHMSRALRRPD